MSTPDYMKHPTVRVSVILPNEKGELLLIRHRKPTRSYWVLPGGHLDYGETLEGCAVRELKEETNLDIRVEKMLYVSQALAPDKSRHIVNLYFLAKLLGGELKLGEEEVLEEAKFIPIAEIERLTLYPSVTRELLDSFNKQFMQEILYLGNRWD